MARTVDIARVGARLQAICERAHEFESRYAADLDAVHPEYRDSARNLVHYLALRESDIRDLQEDLAALGLSSLGRAERDVMASIRAVREAMQRMGGEPGGPPHAENDDLSLSGIAAARHRRDMLGEGADGRNVCIMVTLPREAAEDYSLVAGMVTSGMDVARINCAHDDEETWRKMVGNVRKAGKETGTECRIVMDLPGPKIRTGDLRPGPKVVHIRPRRDPMGRVIAPRRIRFIPDDTQWTGTKAAVIPVPQQCIQCADVGDFFRFRDTRGKKRKLEVVQKDDKGLVVETFQGSYITTGTRLRLIRQSQDEKLDYKVGELPAIEQPLLLRPGDTLILHRDSVAGAPAVEDADGEITEPAHISCRQPEVFEYVSAGDWISLNDGKIGGVIESADEDRLLVEIRKAKPTGSRLRADRGINFPDSDIRLPGLTMTDKACLPFIVKYADSISLSFVRRPGDIGLLHEELDRLGDDAHGLVVKIETQKGFKKLPKLMLMAMRRYPAAVMIARGDLAVECGWSRLAELQEEILWLCEAARLPVIWATQVLERTAKKGLPSRAEISDAALAQRADCVMLNKGPHIIKAIRILDNILRRMQEHQYKKTSRLKKLSITEE